MITASKANPLYRLTKRSRIIPVAVLMIIAPNNGVHPCEISPRTYGFLRTYSAHPKEDIMRRTQKTRGRGVLTKPMRNVETSPRRQRVMRSPKQAAMGGAILSDIGSGYAWRT